MERRNTNCPVLTPIDFLLRSADVFPDRIAVINGSQKFTWKEHADRCKKLACALTSMGIRRGDIVAVLAPNSPAIIEAHFAIPMAGAVINALNIRLDPAAIAFILEHSEAKLMIVDQEFGQLAKDAIALMKNPIEVVDVIDPEASGDLVRVGDREYES